MASIVTSLWTVLYQGLITKALTVEADVSSGIRSSFDDLIDQAQTTHGVLMIAGVLVLAWLAFRVFR